MDVARQLDMASVALHASALASLFFLRARCLGLHVIALPSGTVRRSCLTLAGQTHCLGLELRGKNPLPDCRSSVATLCKIALTRFEVAQPAEPTRCAHMIRGKPRRLVPSMLSNPCSSFILGERTGERG